MPVEQRPARIARIDRRVRLNGLVNLHAVGLLHRANRTDDATGHGTGQPERIADGIHFLPYLQIARIAQHHGRKLRAFDLNHRQIVGAVGTDHGGAVFFAVVQRHFHLPGVRDHVIVGQHVAFFIDDES